MPNPRAQRPLSLQAVTEDIRSLAQPAEALLDMLAGAAKGSVTATAGIGGDLESLARGLAAAYRAPSGQRMDAFAGGMDQPTVLPTTQDISAKLPAVVPTTAPLSRQHTAEYGQGMGEFIPTPGSGKVIKGGLSMAGQALNDRLLAGQSLTPFLNTPAPITHVIKPKGGNWLTGSVEKELNTLKRNKTAAQALEEMERVYPPDVMERMSPETRAQVERAIPHLQRESALNNWVDRNLTNFVKKEMATPEDPVRKLAEQGITHYPVAEDPGYWARHGATAREERGGEAMAQSPLAKQWENRTDAMIDRESAQQHQDMMHLAPGMYSDQDAWIKKLDPSTQLYSAQSRHFSPLDLGFDHILDVLREDLATGRIRPEQLNKVSMEQAVRRTYEYDQELAKKMAEARAAAREGLPVHKEYPEGFRWVELNKPGAFATESEAMGHSVRGYEPPKGHADWTEGSGDAGSLGYGHGGWEAIKSGKAKVYSLVDPKGNPHVTVETKADENPYISKRGSITDKGLQLIRRKFPESNFDTEYGDWFSNSNRHSMHFADEYAPWIKRNYPEIYNATIGAPMGRTITQIKGKQNAAPKEEYLPFVQDFVRGGQWSDVGDLKNTGLRQVGSGKYATDAELAALAARHYPEHPGMTPADVLMHYERMKGMPEFQNDITKKFIEDLEAGNYNPPTEGMKRGGSVHISDNPDTQMMELSIGGVTRVAKTGSKAKKAAKAEPSLPLNLPRAPAKSKEEIRPIAQRMAEQMTGEFVRPNPKKSINPAGKSFDQFKMEQSLQHDIRPRPGKVLLPQEVADIEKQKGMLKMGISGDTTISDQDLYRAGDYILDIHSPQHGGALYGLGGEGAWASNNPVASVVQKRVQELSRAHGDVPVLGQYVAMGPGGSNFALHFADANLRAIDPTKMTREQIDQVNKLIRAGNKKTGEVPSFPGIEDKDSAYLHFAFNPELRKHFNSIMQKPTITSKLGLPDGRVIHHAITEPELRNMEILTSGKSQMHLDPSADPEALALSEHPTYSHVIPNVPGSPILRTKYPTPAEIEFPDVEAYIRANVPEASHTRMYQTATPRQMIDQQHIDEIKMYEELMKHYTGKKKGGRVKKAAGGEITADDLILEERKL